MQAQTPEVSAEKATTPYELRLVSVEQLKTIHRDLDACQKVIWLAGCRPHGYGFDPSYVTDAQERLKEIETLIVEPAPAQGEREAFELHAALKKLDIGMFTPPSDGEYRDARTQAAWEGWQAHAARPAQTEQHPIYQIRPRENVRDWLDTNADGYRAAKAMASMEVRMLYAAPIAQTAPLVVPDECPHIIVFDDADRENEMFAGCGARPAAMRRFEQISQSWNAHLFVRIEKNSRDAPYPCATAAPQPEQINLRALLNNGTALSNIAYNLAQRPGVTLDKIVCDTLLSACRGWDAACATLRTEGGE